MSLDTDIIDSIEELVYGHIDLTGIPESRQDRAEYCDLWHNGHNDVFSQVDFTLIPGLKCNDVECNLVEITLHELISQSAYTRSYMIPSEIVERVKAKIDNDDYFTIIMNAVSCQLFPLLPDPNAVN